MQTSRILVEQPDTIRTQVSSYLEILTRREREVLGLIGQGLSLIDIAKQLHRSYATIKTHRCRGRLR